MWSCWPARDWTSQISYEAVASVVRELTVFEALMCFFTTRTKYNAPLASVSCNSDDYRAGKAISIQSGWFLKQGKILAGR